MSSQLQFPIKFFKFFIQAIFLTMPPLIAQEEKSFHPIDTKTKEKLPINDEISDWEARLEFARLLSYMQRYEESLKEYQKLLAETPTSPIARREKATVLFYAGHTDESFLEFSLVADADRDDKTWLVIADIFVKQKNYSRAETIYSQHLKKDEKNDNVRLKLASLLSWQQRYDESILQYKTILNHRPEDIQVRRRYAQVLTWIGNEEAAIDEWKKTLP